MNNNHLAIVDLTLVTPGVSTLKRIEYVANGIVQSQLARIFQPLIVLRNRHFKMNCNLKKSNGAYALYKDACYDGDNIFIDAGIYNLIVGKLSQLYI